MLSVPRINKSYFFLMDIIKRIDLFPIKANFLCFDNKRIYQTYVGAFFSFVIIVISSYYFYLQMDSLLSRSKPNIIDEYVYQDDPERIIFLNNQPIIIGFDHDRKLVDLQEHGESFKLMITQVVVEITSQGIQTTVIDEQVKLCSESKYLNEHIEDLNYDSSLTQFSKNAWCVVPGELEKVKFDLQGKFGSIRYSSVMLTIYVYDNLLENLSDLTMLMLYPSTEVKKLSRKDPFKSYLKRAVISIQNKRRVYGNFYYTSTVINTFEDFYSFFFQKEIVDKSLIQDTQNIVQLAISEGLEQIAIFNFFLSDNKYVITKTYGNVLGIFGDLVGLINVLLFIFTVFLTPLQYFLFFISYIPQLFKIDFTQDQNSQRQIIPSGQDDAFTKDKKKIKSNKKTSLTDFILYAYNVSKGYIRIYYGSDYVERYFNAQTLIDTVRNVTLLNHYLLNENERKLIRFIKQPNIEKLSEPDKEKQKFSEFQQNLLHQEEEINEEEGYKVYENYISNNPIQAERFLKLLDEESIQEWKARYEERQKMLHPHIYNNMEQLEEYKSPQDRFSQS